MKIQKNRTIALGTLGVMTASTLGGFALTSAPAEAGSKGRRNTTIGLGAITAYGILKKKPIVAIAGGIGTAVAYSKYKKAKKAERRNESARVNWYKNRYGRFWRNYYKPGA